MTARKFKGKRPTPEQATPTGRPRIVASAEDLVKIETMAGYGLTQRMMATILGWSEGTFTSRKQEDPRVFAALEAGQAKAQLNVGKALYERAVGGDTAAIRWFEITRCGRSDRVRQVDEQDDYPGMDQILSLSTDEKIAELRSLVAPYRPKSTNGNGNGKANGRNGRGK
jgi:hypothetical protein